MVGTFFICSVDFLCKNEKVETKKRGKKTAVTLEAARESKLDNLTWRT